MSKDTTVDFTIYFQKGKLAELEAGKGDHGCNGLEKLLKLYTTVSTSNMHLFDAHDKLKKYDTVQDIMDDYYVTRLELYQTRKDYLINALEKEVAVLSNKARYIQEVLADTVDLRKKTKEQVMQMLTSKGYDPDSEDAPGEFKYLTRMPMDSVTQENVQKLLSEKENKEKTLTKTKATTTAQMWLQELDVLSKEYVGYVEDRQRSCSSISDTVKIKVVKKKVSTTDA